MSKIVKKVTRAVSKVVKGAVKAVTGVVKGVVNVVKKVASSPIGKILIGAAALYFGVPMISGALGGASAGFAAGNGFFGTIGSTLSGAFTGASAGLSQAWTGLTGALGSSSLSAAGEALSGGFSPSAAFSAGNAAATPLAGSGVLSGVTGQGAGLSVPGAPAGGAASSTTGLGGSSGFQAINPTMSPANYSLTAGPGVTPAASMAGQADLLAGQGIKYTASAAAGGAPAATPGVLSSMWNSPYTAPALIQAGGQVVSAVGSGIAQKAQQEEQERLAEEERRRRNINVGTPLWNTQPAVQFGRG